MNIEQYREIKAQEEIEKASQASVDPTLTPSASVDNTENIEQTTPNIPVVPAIPEKVTIDGVGEVSFDELKNGYLRQSDYTKKTTEVAKQKKEVEEAVTLYNYLKQNPQISQQIVDKGGFPAFDPVQDRIKEMEEKLYDMQLQSEIEQLQHKYPDFEIRTVLETAQSKNITNLEDAYILSKGAVLNQPKDSGVNVEEIEKQLREKIMAELAIEMKGTQTIITSNSTPVEINNTPTLNSSEKRVAQMMGLSDSEYVKYRDMR